MSKCKGIEIEPGIFSGCKGLSDCPTCEGKKINSTKITDYNFFDLGIEEVSTTETMVKFNLKSNQLAIVLDADDIEALSRHFGFIK